MTTTYPARSEDHSRDDRERRGRTGESDRNSALATRCDERHGNEPERDRLDEDREGPRDPGKDRAFSLREHEPGEDERHHPHVVVTSARRVQREERVPADDGCGKRPTPCTQRGERDEREHACGGGDAERPFDSVAGRRCVGDAL
jgi:hypothetical protein